MVKCKDCGFCELARGGNLGKPHAFCTADLNEQRSVSYDGDIKCKKFVAKRTGWLTKDFHEWKDRHITARRTFYLAAASIALSVLMGVGSVIYTNSMTQQRFEVGLRANLRILDDFTYSITDTVLTLNISGQLRNEGFSATVIKYIDVEVEYSNKNGDIFGFLLQRIDNASRLGWSNMTLIEKQANEFAFRINFSYGAYAYIEPYQTPDKCIVNVYHDDGLGVEEYPKPFLFT